MAEPVLTVDNVKKYYPIPFGRLYREQEVLKAVDGVSLTVGKGETLGLVGESGCGKSTLSKLIVRLLAPTEGHIYYGGTEVTAFTARQLRPLRRYAQMVFQDPYGSLNPRYTVREILAAPLTAMEQIDAAKQKEGRRRERTGEEQNANRQDRAEGNEDAQERMERQRGPQGRAEQREGKGDAAVREAKIREMLDLVGLPLSYLDKYPHEMSGGQRQRVSIARAMVSDPALVVCDEPVSALDPSVQGQILNFMRRFQREKGVSYLFISHDFGTVRFFCDRVAVMYMGRIVEEGTRDDIFSRPVHPYTKALLAANPVPNVHAHRNPILLQGDAAASAFPPSGCVFRNRCLYATEGCAKGPHLLTPLHRTDGTTHSSACPRYPRGGAE